MTQSQSRAPRAVPPPETAAAVPDVAGSYLLSVNYDASGLAWAQIFDNPVLAWVIDQTGAVEPVPTIIGALPPEAPDTTPVASPQWAHCVNMEGVSAVLVPDLWRGRVVDFLTWLATNNGAQRQLTATLLSPHLANIWEGWARQNPSLVHAPNA